MGLSTIRKQQLCGTPVGIFGSIFFGAACAWQVPDQAGITLAGLVFSPIIIIICFTTKTFSCISPDDRETHIAGVTHILREKLNAAHQTF